MCLSIPAQVIAVNGKSAQVYVPNVGTHQVLLGLEAAEGDWVLLQSGIAVGRLSPDEAAETISLLMQMKSSTPNE